ncbi:MAG: radical SAM protein, partial [Candidatus Omnitrophota bacterium]
LDFNTPDLIRRLYPSCFSQKITPIVGKFMSGKSLSLKEIFKLWLIEKKLNYHQNNEAVLIGKEIARMVENEAIDFIGLKLWNGDGFTGSLRIAHELKKTNPKFPIFAGGPHVDIFREHIYTATDDFDALAYGEGEETIVRLAEYVEGRKKLQEIPNLIFKKNGRVITTPIKRIENLNTLHYPIYDEEIYPAMKGNEKIKMIILDESRGCNNSCYFCIHPLKSGRLRVKSAERIVDEMIAIKKRYGIGLFRYAGSNTPLELMEKIAKEILKRELKVEYTTFGHIRGTNLGIFKLLKSSGCFGIFFGIESGSQRILDKGMNKGVKIEQIKKAMLNAKEAGLFTAGSVIFPSPGETETTAQETLNLLSEIMPDSAPVQFPLIVPGTKWANEPAKFGFQFKKYTLIQKTMNYKIKFMFPPRFWKPFPYKVNGKKFKEYAQELERFMKKVENLGITTTISDEMALLAKYANLSPLQYRDENRLNLLTGNFEDIRRQIQEINKNIFSSKTEKLKNKKTNL